MLTLFVLGLLIIGPMFEVRAIRPTNNHYKMKDRTFDWLR